MPDALRTGTGQGAATHAVATGAMPDHATPPTQDGLKPRNRVLASLPRKDLRHLWPDLEPVALPQGEVLLEAGEAPKRAYFIEAGVVALMVVFEDGTSAVSAIVGREGVVGVGALFGGDADLGRHVVRVTGSALTMEACRFRAALRDTPRLHATCQSYARAFLGQVLQTIACHSVHTLEQRCARWLLMIHDRSNGDTLALRQEFLAEMLGVRPSAVAAVTRPLRKAGLIRHCQGEIRVLDRARLESAACECYGIDRERYQQLPSTAFDQRERSQLG